MLLNDYMEVALFLWFLSWQNKCDLYFLNSFYRSIYLNYNVVSVSGVKWFSYTHIYTQLFASANPKFPLHSSPTLIPLATTGLFSVSLFLFHRWVHSCPVLDSTHKWCHMVFVSFWLHSGSYIQYLIITYNGKELLKVYIYTYIYLYHFAVLCYFVWDNTTL